MRYSASIIALAAAVLLALCGSIAPVQAAQPGVSQIADDGAVVPAQCQEPCETCEQPCVLGSMVDRFINPCQCDPRWAFTADGVGLQRTHTRKQPLFLDANGGDLLNANRLDPSASMGFQLSAIRHGPCGWDLELGYFQIDGWIANHDVGASTLVTDAVTGGFSLLDGSARYWSGLHLAEINVRREWFEGVTLLAGFRFGELDESYNAGGTDATTTLRDTLNIKSFNHLYGFQVGGEWEFYNMGGPLRVSAICKAGLYDNLASQAIHRDDSLADNQSFGNYRDQAAFMGEAGAIARYDINCHLSFRAGLEAVWLEGLALAPEQIDQTDFRGGAAGINTHGSLFYYGGSLGMEVKF